ncbi:MAG: hypothetical protein ABWX89_06445 [Paeniglutamicibacter terrestris]|jgi:hypothetical protein
MTLNFVAPDAGAWIVDALQSQGRDAQTANLVSGQVPASYAAYVRIFHPAMGLDGQPVSWGEIAARRGSTMHPLAQFAALSGIGEDGVPLAEDSWEGEAPGWDGLGAQELAAIAPLLVANTQSPDEIYLALWNGLAFIHGGDQVEITIEDDPALSIEQNLVRAADLAAAAKAPAFSHEDRNGPTLTIGSGYRSFYLFSGDGTDLRSPLWARTSLGEQRQSPNLAWPKDRAWILSTELYEDSTIVGGSKELINALLACPGVEALEVSADARLDAQGDTHNQLPIPDATPFDPEELAGEYFAGEEN